ncbi:tRNA adenosine deaminase-associated protein [Streptomyces fuscigenes]|uniref:tRNA adenosine deaminase-associated protein n=1 Tax=Streptomyces fuscigenes TaxID=1528880 RepID=UPI001F366D06|nr:hypothetical protein [Streptomyces fuscigenes]MCF3964627.1 hypothetical protein [Streptomyces fuscigenes]
MYFAALLARTEDGWEASDTDLDDVETLADLTDLAREASVDEDVVLLFIEQEDAWFGILRVEGEDDPRIYVSDAAAAARSSYGEILIDELTGGDEDDASADLDLDTLDLDGTEDGEAEPSENDTDDTDGPDDADDPRDLRAGAGEHPTGPVGDRGILTDLGLAESELLDVETDAMAEIAEALGATDVLETVR